VQVVDEELEVLGRPEAARRRKVARDLEAPRASVGLLGEREQLDVREAHIEVVVGQVDRHLAVGQEASFFHRARLMALRLMFPRAQVDLVERYRRIEPLAASPLRAARAGD